MGLMMTGRPPPHPSRPLLSKGEELKNINRLVEQPTRLGSYPSRGIPPGRLLLPHISSLFPLIFPPGKKSAPYLVDFKLKSEKLPFRSN